MAQPDKIKEDKAKTSQQVSTEEQAVVPVQPEPATEEAPTTPTTPDQPPVTPTEPAPSPDFGEDPDKPGWFKVFNKTALMTQAGIPADQQATADAVITKRSSWYYQTPTVPYTYATLCHMNARHSYSLMDDPVKQLSLCHAKALALGGWQAWLNTL